MVAPEIEAVGKSKTVIGRFSVRFCEQEEEPLATFIKVNVVVAVN